MKIEIKDYLDKKINSSIRPSPSKINLKQNVSKNILELSTLTPKTKLSNMTQQKTPFSLNKLNPNDRSLNGKEIVNSLFKKGKSKKIKCNFKQRQIKKNT